MGSTIQCFLLHHTLTYRVNLRRYSKDAKCPANNWCHNADMFVGVESHLERAENCVRLLVGPFTPTSFLVDLVIEEHTTVENLRAATVIKGPNDPTTPGADKPWLKLIRQLLLDGDPQAAAKAARVWYGALLTSNMETDQPVLHRGLAAYVVGVIEALLGNDVKPEQWLAVAKTEAELDEDAWTPVLAACRVVRDASNSSAT